MSDTTPGADDPREGGRSGDVAGRGDVDENETNDQYSRLTRYVNYAVLAGLLFLAFVAVVQFYFAASSTIATWISPDYRAPFRMVFNLVVLLVAGLGISLQLRRLAGRSNS